MQELEAQREVAEERLAIPDQLRRLQRNSIRRWQITGRQVRLLIQMVVQMEPPNQPPVVMLTWRTRSWYVFLYIAILQFVTNTFLVMLDNTYREVQLGRGV